MSQKYALLIGNAEYQEKSLNLTKPPQNVAGLAELLQDPTIGGFEPGNVSTRVDHTQRSIRKAISDFFANRKRDDLLLLYYTGHGFLDRRRRLHFAVEDMEKGDLAATALSATYIIDQISDSRARQVILILDCCYSGAFPQTDQGAPGATVIALTASDGHELAWEGEETLGELQYTVFTHHLLDGLSTGAADINRNETISSNELYEYIQAQMKDSVQKPQRLLPFGRFEHDIIIAKAPPIVDPGLLDNHYFISYAPTDGDAFATELHRALSAANVPVWRYKEDGKQYGLSWDKQISEAIQTSAGVLFVVTRDSDEMEADWTQALRYKKPIIPIPLEENVALPYRLAHRQAIDFSAAAGEQDEQQFARRLSRLREHLDWLRTPDGELQQLKDRLADAQLDLLGTHGLKQHERIKEDIAKLRAEIETKEKYLADPRAAAERVKTSISSGIERERRPEKPVRDLAQNKFINPPPGVAPSYFQDRFQETKLVADFLKDEALCLMIISGRGGIGKTAMVTRLLKRLQNGQLPDDLGPLRVDGIVYLSARGSRKITFPNLYADLSRLLSSATAKDLESLFRDPQLSTEAKMEALLANFPPTHGAEEADLGREQPSSGPVILLLDNFEDVVDPASRNISDPELNEALRAILSAAPHRVKVIVTTRVAPRDVQLLNPQNQMLLPLDHGLESPYAENVLREMDVDGKIGLRDASDDLLQEARKRTRGYPKALEALFAILSADRDTSLDELLADADTLLPENVVEVLVGEAFNRLDATTQKVMQALAIYAYPVTPNALDYLLEPYQPGVDTVPILSQLVNMQFVRKEAGRYYLHPVDQAYALARIPKGELADRQNYEALFKLSPPFNQIALYDRGAAYFKETRQPRESWKTIDDLAPQLKELDLRYKGQDYEAAARVLLEINYDYLFLWGYWRLLVERYELLIGKISDPRLKGDCLNSLASSYYYLGQMEQAIKHAEESLAIAREFDDRRVEGISLGSLANSYMDLGQVEQAIKYNEEALTIFREFSDRQGEGVSLGNLAIAYSDLGQMEQAIKYNEEALAIAREINDRHNEGISLGNLAYRYFEFGQMEQAIKYYEDALPIVRELADRRVESIILETKSELLLVRHKTEKAIQASRQAIRIADETGFRLTQNEGRWVLALAYLTHNDLPAARTTIEAARKFDLRIRNFNVSALLGVIALRQEELVGAQQAFKTAFSQTEELLADTPHNYRALYTKGLILCGLALCTDEEPKALVAQAIEAYQAARAITSAAGIVKRELLTFDALAVADKDAVLAGVRPVLKGQE